jgi:PAS domain S-box-containing protein
MKLLSLASVGMTVTLIVAGTQTSGPEASVQLATSLLTMLSVVFFYLAFAPPALVRMAWRRPEQEALRHATEQLIRATTEEEVIDSLLPHVTRTVGARGALLSASDGRKLGVHGDVGAAGDGSVAWDATEEGSDLVSLELDFGRLVIWASPYTPFFGREELELLQSLGILTGLALDRTQLYQSEKEARASLERANRQLQATNVRLEESRASLAEAQSIAHIGSYASELATGRTSWSDELYSIFGADPETFVVDTESYYTHVHPDDRPGVEEIVADAIAERRPYAFDHRVTRLDGEQRILHARGKVETDESGQPVRLVGTLQDVTAAREAERRVAIALSSEREARKKLEDLNTEMESFVYTVSHDLNSPIIAIQGFAEFLEKDHASDLPDRGRFYIERIQASVGYLQSLIKDLLAFSRVGRVQTESERVELGPLVRQASDEVRAGCPGFRLHVGELPAVHMNPLRARQLFTNLMQNSCRYAGRPDVVVSVASERDEGGMVRISVHDNGPGIPAEDRTKAFGVFERLQREGTPDGSGMGLPICKRIVETTGGSMWIEDSEQGLDLRFTLPLGPSEVVTEEIGETV